MMQTKPQEGATHSFLKRDVYMSCHLDGKTHCGRVEMLVDGKNEGAGLFLK